MYGYRSSALLVATFVQVKTFGYRTFWTNIYAYSLSYVCFYVCTAYTQWFWAKNVCSSVNFPPFPHFVKVLNDTVCLGHLEHRSAYVRYSPSAFVWYSLPVLRCVTRCVTVLHHAAQVHGLGLRSLSRRELELYFQMPRDMRAVAPVLLVAALPLALNPNAKRCRS